LLIEIGRDPDFVMKRGLEILNHKLKLVIHSRGHKIFDETFTHRSLATVLRSGSYVFECHNLTFSTLIIAPEINIDQEWIKVTFQKSKLRIEYSFCVPLELSKRQAELITGQYVDLFKNT
jgi:hypothetical protein